MKKITFLRHARPCYPSLDESAKADCFLRALSLKDSQFDCVITSQALRAKLTCLAILEALDRSIDGVIELESLHLALGEVEFLNLNECHSFNQIIVFLKEKAPNLIRAFEYIQTAWQTSHHIMIIAHSGVINFLGFLLSQKDFLNIHFNYLEGFTLIENNHAFEMEIVK